MVVTGKAASADPRVVIVDGDRIADVFETLSVGDTIVVRTAFLFEIGEELKLRVDGRDVTARVKKHTDGTTELEPI